MPGIMSEGVGTAYGSKWHFSSNRCNAQFRELLEAQRTCRERRERLDPTKMTRSGG
jgi:hypothetical protein